ncbi:hypothetical protein ACEZCY_16375 [Streptacidiphilus sp. N1-12]|uniref:Uncharacterized protein n=2 Tax=Streptacidiphilus alkalitolerans TaxID=3342712 RepID=A0ABV6VAM4_9ACTN
MTRTSAPPPVTHRARTDIAAAILLVLGNFLGLGAVTAVVHADFSDHSNAMADADPAEPPALS